MKDKILILTIYPAPYRIYLYKQFEKQYDVDVFCLNYGGDERDKTWFEEGNYYVLENKADYEYYKSLNLKDYKLVLIYEYANKTAIKLISKLKRLKVPYVINCDGVRFDKHGNFVRNMIKRYAIKGASKFFASGEYAAKYFIKYGAKREDIFFHTFSTLEDNDVIDKPLSANEKQIIREKFGIDKNCKLALAVGRFIPLKRYAELIQEWANMPKDNYLLLIGGGRLEEEYKGLISSLGLTNVMIRGFCKKSELFELYKCADVFVHPTSYDVWGLVINEAMANGVPCVTTDCCVAGLELIKDGENGYVVKLGDDKSFMERTKLLLQDDDLRYKIGQNSIETIKDYTLSNMAVAQLKAIAQTINNF